MQQLHWPANTSVAIERDEAKERERKGGGKEPDRLAEVKLDVVRDGLCMAGVALAFVVSKTFDASCFTR